MYRMRNKSIDLIQLFQIVGINEDSFAMLRLNHNLQISRLASSMMLVMANKVIIPQKLWALSHLQAQCSRKV